MNNEINNINKKDILNKIECDFTPIIDFGFNINTMLDIKQVISFGLAALFDKTTRNKEEIESLFNFFDCLDESIVNTIYNYLINLNKTSVEK